MIDIPPIHLHCDYPGHDFDLALPVENDVQAYGLAINFGWRVFRTTEGAIHVHCPIHTEEENR